MYADRNADMIGAFIRAAALFDDPWLRDFALKSLEAVVVPGYVPGQGVAHDVRRWRRVRRHGSAACSPIRFAWPRR